MLISSCHLTVHLTLSKNISSTSAYFQLDSIHWGPRSSQISQFNNSGLAGPFLSHPKTFQFFRSLIIWDLLVPSFPTQKLSNYSQLIIWDLLVPSFSTQKLSNFSQLIIWDLLVPSFPIQKLPSQFIYVGLAGPLSNFSQF